MGRSNFITLNEMKDITTSILHRTGYPLQWNGSVEAVPIEDIIELQQLNLLYIDSNKGIHSSKEEAIGLQRLF